MSQQGFLMKRSGGKFTGSSYGNRKNKLDRRWFRIREGALYYYKQSSEMKESTHHAGKVALEGTQVLAGGDGVISISEMKMWMSGKPLRPTSPVKSHRSPSPQ